MIDNIIKLTKLLDLIKKMGGYGEIFKCDWKELAQSKEIALFFLSLNKVYVATLTENGYVVGVVINSPNKIGGSVDVFGHYCFNAPDFEVLSRLQKFFSVVDDRKDLYNLSAELNVNNNVNQSFKSIAKNINCNAWWKPYGNFMRIWVKKKI